MWSALHASSTCSCSTSYRSGAALEGHLTWRLLRQPRQSWLCRAGSSSNGNSSRNGGGCNGSGSGNGSQLPPELQGLAINDKGFLVDEATGEVINEYGATRFDVAVRALRGEFDPADKAADTDRAQGVLMESLVQFPCDYKFQIVAKGVQNRTAFLNEVVGCISRVCQVDVSEDDCTVTERMGGKYLSVRVTAMARSPESITKVFEELGTDERIIMKY